MNNNFNLNKIQNNYNNDNNKNNERKRDFANTNQNFK